MHVRAHAVLCACACQSVNYLSITRPESHVTNKYRGKRGKALSYSHSARKKKSAHHVTVIRATKFRNK